MNGFLARWAEGETESTAPSRDSEAPTAANAQVWPETTERGESRSRSPAEWKAAQLNRLFEEQGVTGKASRITAETVRGNGKRETANETKEGPDETTERPSAHETAD